MDFSVLYNDEDLQLLTQLLGGTLYAVGGAVRDIAAGFKPSDVDIAAPIAPKKVIDRLVGSGFKVSTTSAKMGTLKIAKGGKFWEYTCFRTDSYAAGGNHAPATVTFTEDLTKDAFRRDFTVNAIYFDIAKGVVVDPTNGLADVEKKTIRTTRAPSDVLKEDGLRLMRLVRIAAETGYEIDPATATAARENASLLADIAAERKKDELCKMLVSDTKNGIAEAQYRAMCLMLQLGLWQYVVPRLLQAEGVTQNPKFHRYDVLGHIFNTVRLSSPEVRLAALMHDIGKAECKAVYGNMHEHASVGARFTREILTDLKFSNAEIDLTTRLVAAHMFDLNCETGERKYRRFVQQNYDVIAKLAALKTADGRARGFDDYAVNPSAVRLTDTFSAMLAEGVPMCIKDLKVGGKDLIELGVAPESRSVVLSELLALAANDETLLTREGQLRFLATRAVR